MAESNTENARGAKQRKPSREVYRPRALQDKTEPKAPTERAANAPRIDGAGRAAEPQRAANDARSMGRPPVSTGPSRPTAAQTPAPSSANVQAVEPADKKQPKRNKRPNKPRGQTSGDAAGERRPSRAGTPAQVGDGDARPAQQQSNARRGRSGGGGGRRGGVRGGGQAERGEPTNRGGDRRPRRGGGALRPGRDGPPSAAVVDSRVEEGSSGLASGRPAVVTGGRGFYPRGGRPINVGGGINGASTEASFSRRLGYQDNRPQFDARRSQASVEPGLQHESTSSSTNAATDSQAPDLSWVGGEVVYERKPFDESEEWRRYLPTPARGGRVADGARSADGANVDYKASVENVMKDSASFGSMDWSLEVEEQSAQRESVVRPRARGRGGGGLLRLPTAPPHAVGVSAEPSGRGGARGRGFSGRPPPRFSRADAATYQQQQQGSPAPPALKSLRGSDGERAAAEKGPEIERRGNKLLQLMGQVQQQRRLDLAARLAADSLSVAEVYRDLLTVDAQYTYQVNLESHMWRQCFHAPIECLRAVIVDVQQAADHDVWITCLRRFLDQVIVYYEHLLTMYEAMFKFRLVDFMYWDGEAADVQLAALSVTRDERRRDARIALLSCQRFMTALGDLHRYHFHHVARSHGAVARSWYMKALQLSPGYGRAYNQLAVLAVHQTRRLEAVYFYLRALAAKYSYESAKHAVDLMFTETARKVHSYESELQALIQQSSSNVGRRARDEMRNAHVARREIWVGGAETAADAAQKQSEDVELGWLTCAAASDLHTRTLSYFVHVVGRLFCKIGMEDFESLAEKALIQMDELLRRDESPLTALELVQLTMCTLFCVYHTAAKNADENVCSQLQLQSVQLVFALFGVLLRPLAAHLSFHEVLQVAGPPVHPAVCLVLPALRLMTNWISMPDVFELYRDLPNLDGLDTPRFSSEVWHNLALVATQLIYWSRDLYLMESARKHSPGFEGVVVLPEDQMITSFCRFTSDSAPTQLYMSQVAMDTADEATKRRFALHARLSSVLTAADFLDGMELPTFRHDANQDKFIALACSPADSDDNSPTVRRRATASDDESSVLAAGSRANNELEGVSEDFRRLHARRLGQREKEVRRVHSAAATTGVQAALALEADGACLEIVVEPTFVVPDTNTFIDHLRLFTALLHMPTRRFKICVPVVVLRELGGLSIGLPDNEWVAQRARLALQCLHVESERKDVIGLVAVTSKGNLINSLQFACEEDESCSKQINDDRILLCCNSFEDDKAPRTEIRDLRHEALRLRRKSVLLTDDRALRVKALSKNIPVKTIVDFARWCGCDTADIAR